jgi:hypothetical protein
MDRWQAVPVHNRLSLFANIPNRTRQWSKLMTGKQRHGRICDRDDAGQLLRRSVRQGGGSL